MGASIFIYIAGDGAGNGPKPIVLCLFHRLPATTIHHCCFSPKPVFLKRFSVSLIFALVSLGSKAVAYKCNSDLFLGHVLKPEKKGQFSFGNQSTK